MSIQVTGLKETLRDLNKLDPALRREIGKDIRNVVKPVADTINSRLPGGAPLSGMNHGGRTGWARRKPVAVKLDTRKPRNYPGRPFYDIVSVVRVGTKDAPTAIVDMAGKKTQGRSGAGSSRGQRFVYNLSATSVARPASCGRQPRRAPRRSSASSPISSTRSPCRSAPK